MGMGVSYIVRRRSRCRSLHYIALLTGALARLAEDHDLDTLTYILGMVRLEADQSLNTVSLIGFMNRLPRIMAVLV